MPLTPPNPYELVSTALKNVIDTEFAPEGIVAVHDNLHESLGLKRIDVGIAPLRDYPGDVTKVAANIYIEIRFYDLWEKKIDPEQSVDPTRITEFNERLKRALVGAEVPAPGSAQFWYFEWLGTDYPNDPTGNRTRFHMSVRSWSDNTGLIETRG